MLVIRNRREIPTLGYSLLVSVIMLVIQRERNHLLQTQLIQLANTAFIHHAKRTYALVEVDLPLRTSNMRVPVHVLHLVLCKILI